MSAPAAAPRRARWPRVLAWLGGAIVLLALLGAVLLWWLLASGGGRDFVLARVAATLPAGALQYRAAEGSVAGPLVLHDVRYAQDDGLLVELRRVTLDLSPRALLGRRLVVERLVLEDGRVVLAPSAEEATPSHDLVLPESLPALDLPLGVVVTALDVRRLRIEQADVPLLDIAALQLQGALEQGRLALRSLRLDSDRLGVDARGDFDSERGWASTLDATVTLPRADADPLPLALTLRGDLSDLQLGVRGDLPQPASVDLRITGGLPSPRFALRVVAPQIDAALLGLEGAPVSANLRVDGTLQRVQLEGEVAQGAQSLRIAPSTIGYAGGVLELAPLSLELLSGSAVAQGRVDLRDSAPSVGLDLVWRDITLPADTPEATVRTGGSARIDGPLADYAIVLDGELARGDDAATVALHGRGTRDRIALETANVTMPGGGLAANGSVAWTPQVAWTLDAELSDFDPAWFATAFPGAIDATLHSEGRLEDAGPAATLRVAKLGGTLRGRTLAGTLDATLQPDASGEAKADLRVGQSRIRGNGRWGERIAADLSLSPLNLADVLPDARGRIEGTLTASGTQDAPTLATDLAATDLSIADTTVASADVRARIDALQRGSFSVEATGLEAAGQSFATLSLSGEGTRERHTLTLALDGEPARVSLELAGGLIAPNGGAARWRGLLDALTLEPAERAPWRLRAPAELAYDSGDGELRITRACLASEPAALCVSADWHGAGGDADLSLQAFPLSDLDPFLAEAFGHPVAAFGEVNATARATRAANGDIDATAQLDIARAGLRMDAASERELIALQDLQLRATLTPEQLLATVTGGVGNGGRIDARLVAAAPLADDGALDGSLALSLPDLTVLELLTDQVVAPAGTLEANVSLAGTRGLPQVEGRARVAGFRGEIPAAGLLLSDGDLVFESAGPRAGTLAGSVKSGDGTLRIDGRVDGNAGAAEAVRIALQGENLTVVKIPEAEARVSPDLTVVLADERLRLRGTVTVPYARIDLEQLQGTTTPSSDVVVVDAHTEEDAGLGLDSDIAIVLGDDVRLNGFGLKSKLDGQLAVRDRPGRATLGAGAIQVGGAYKAYGQDLTITRGRLSFASTPIDNPAVDLRAERKIDDVTVGVQVRGTALAPELTLWSEPSMEQAEQLSYLVLGRPLRSASQADGAQLSQAAAAFGGNFLAKRLGARMGLDEVGVADNRALGGAALTVGKFLSPRLYVSYGVALFGSGQVVTFKYILSRLWSVQIDSGTENRAALNYRLER